METPAQRELRLAIHAKRELRPVNALELQVRNACERVKQWPEWKKILAKRAAKAAAYVEGQK